MSHYVNRSDAVVALKSFGRRYSDLISGPVGDDAWERLVTTSGTDGKSAVDYVAYAIEQLASFTSLAALVAKVPDSAKRGPFNQTQNTTIDSQSIPTLQAAVKNASTAAAKALEARRDEDYERDMMVGGTTTSLGHLATELVTTLAANLRRGEAAIDAER
jgi:hypothetical protein